MSIEVWPRISPEELQVKKAESLQRELQWITNETLDLVHELKNGIQDCYALIANIEPGSTLVMSTPRNEKVKGTITRMGTEIVRVTLNLQLRMLPYQSLSLSPQEPIVIAPLHTLHAHILDALETFRIILDGPATARHLSACLAILSKSIHGAIAQLKGPPLAETDRSWQSLSCSPKHFSPPLGSNVSFCVGIQECCIVLLLRVLEPVNAPQHFGMKLGLAIGTVRRLEHDEMDAVFTYTPAPLSRPSISSHPDAVPLRGRREDKPQPEDVYVREKVRVESADPNLISLHSKLSMLGHMLRQARRNLAVVLDEEFVE